VIRLVLLRHGESVWNRDKRFTGWTDVELSPRGIAQAEAAGRLLAAEGFEFDVCFTSCLRRASETARLARATMDCPALPIEQSWRLNERHYGALQGLSHWEATRRYGARRMLMWQQGVDRSPPALDPADSRFPGNDPRYAGVAPALLPRTESVKDAQTRIGPYWRDVIVPALRAGRRTLIVGHRNSLRALIREIERAGESHSARHRIPTGRILVYELDDELRPLRHYDLRPRADLWRRALALFR
jgi:2,3-bisphosphoglycerate-dependent phosphoglycerate mutase